MKNYKKIILDNGIPLYLYNDPSMKKVFCSYGVKYGTDGKLIDFELDGKKHHVRFGVPHFLEHLLGEHSCHGNIYTNLTERHAEANAYTADDHTLYHFTGMLDIKKSIKELIEAVDMPVFDTKDVEHSRRAIEEEANGYLDNSRYTAMCLAEKNLYGSYDRYDDSLSSIGDVQNNHDITLDELRTCYDAFYTDDRKFLVIAGNFDEKELVDYLNEVYAKIPRHTSNLVVPTYDLAPLRKPEDTLLRKMAVDFTAYGIKLKRPEGVSNREFQFVTDVFNDYLFDDQSEYMEYLRKNGIIDTLQYCYFNDGGEYMNHMHSVISNKPEEYTKVLFDTLNRKEVPREDFELIKKAFIANEVRALDDKYEAASTFGEKMWYTTDFSQSDFYRSVSYDQFKETLDKIDYNPHTIVKIKSKK